jgi:predicted alpha/beta hydrolase
VARGDAEVVRLTAADGQEIAGAVFGSGPKGVVLGHMGAGNLCPWVSDAKALKAHGYAALPIDFRGFGSSTLKAGAQRFAVHLDVAAAVAELRRRGARSVIVMGASLGAMAGVVAGATITPPIQGVVQISGPMRFPGLDIEKYVKQLRVPVFFIGTDGDTDPTPAVLRQQYAMVPTKDKKILIVGDYEHGTKIFQGRFERKVHVAIADWLAAHSS